MTLAVVLAAVTAVVMSAVTGPAVLRRASPAMAKAPLAAAVGLVLTIVLWIGAVLALGPMLAWVLTGPQLLPAGAAEVCQRCLATAVPIPGPSLETGVPTVILLVAPALLATAGAIVSARHAYTLWQNARATERLLAASSRPGLVLGHRVRRIEQPGAAAFALSRHRGGIVVTDDAVRLLDDHELRAVLEHEAAHIRQRHHLILSAAATIAAPVRRVPLIAAVVDALPQYLEIAADNAARSAVNTPALAAALVKLQQHRVSAHPGALNAVGPNRISHLVAAQDVSRRNAASVVVVLAYVLFSTAITAVTYASYLQAVNLCMPG